MVFVCKHGGGTHGTAKGGVQWCRKEGRRREALLEEQGPHVPRGRAGVEAGHEMDACMRCFCPIASRTHRYDVFERKELP